MPVTLTFDPLTLSIRCHVVKVNLSKIEQSAAELLIILQSFVPAISRCDDRTMFPPNWLPTGLRLFYRATACNATHGIAK